MQRRGQRNIKRTPVGNRKGRNRPRKNKQQNEIQILNEARVPRNLMRAAPFPMEMVRTLTFFEPNLIIQSFTGASFVLREWRINSVFDPDPLIGSGSVAGFPQLAAIYQHYRVENFKVRFEVAGNEPALPLSFGLCFKDAQPSLSVTTYLRAQDALEVGPTTGPHVVGETTGQSVYRSKWLKIRPSSILGNPLTYYADADFSASVTSNPPQLVWMAFLLFAPLSTIPLPNGCVLNMYMSFTTRFYSLRTTLDTLVFDQLQEKRRLPPTKIVRASSH